MPKSIVTTALLIWMGLTAAAQTSTYDSCLANGEQLYLVVKTNNVEYYGFIKKDDGREILLITKNIGKIFIKKEEIKSMTAVSPEELVKTEDQYGDLRTEGPFTTRYFFTTNALAIKKKENYAMLHLYGPEVHFAVTDNFSLGVMTLWGGSPIVLAGKYSFESKTKNHFALGSMVGNSGYIKNGKYFGGLHWATFSRGNRISNVSFSVGLAHINNNDYKNVGSAYNWTWKYNPTYYTEETSMQNALASHYPNKDIFGNLKAKKASLALVTGLAGIHPVGKKASIIFDMMVLFHQVNGIESLSTTDVDVTYTYYDYNQGNVTKTNTATVSENHIVTKTSATFLIMPGMRFNNKYGSAFQVELGMLSTPLSGFTEKNGMERLIIPLPLVTWLRTF
ncbi:MAG: hypothetical protein GC181_10280 [Bacteroidetes bacterium]|nr:hypothetical protein [Bacteroidota bacterium]